jgi:UDP-N-acetylglucosamine 2-epimerase
MTLTEHARRYLIREGLKPETIIKTGSSMLEVLNHHRQQIEASTVLDRLGLKTQAFFVVSAHREETVDSPRNFQDFLDTLKSIWDHYRLRIIVSTHPRTRKKMESLGIEGLATTAEFMKPLGFLDYIKLQMNACCVVSDSGTLTEESAILGFPAIMIRQTHERPEGMDEGTLIMAGLEKESVLNAIDIVMAHARECPRGFRMAPDYDVDNVSKKVVRIIVSYIDYVNRTVWSKCL